MAENKLTAEAMNSHDTTLLRDIDDALANCMKCGNCQAGCPIYRETKKEFSVARGKISLMQAVLSGKLPISEEFDSIMGMCLNCKTCSANCPCGVKADDLILRGRNAAVKARGLHPVKSTVFKLLSNRPLFNAALRMGGMFGWLTFKDIPDKNAVFSRFPVPGMDPNRATAPLASTPLRSEYPEVIKVAGAKRRVAFFTGCTINFMYTDIGKATIEVLKENGNEVVLPGKQHCCGTPVHVAGCFDLANEMAPEHLEVQVKAEIEQEVSDRLLHYGSLFVGHYTPVTFGDYCSGTNHTLPTMRTARYSNGVWAGTFIKTSFIQHITEEGCRNLAPTAVSLAGTEGLMAHQKSITIRMDAMKK